MEERQAWPEYGLHAYAPKGFITEGVVWNLDHFVNRHKDAIEKDEERAEGTELHQRKIATQ